MIDLEVYSTFASLRGMTEEGWDTRVTQIRKSVKLHVECFDSHYIGPEDSKNTKIMIVSARFQLPLAPFSCMLWHM